MAPALPPAKGLGRADFLSSIHLLLLIEVVLKLAREPGYVLVGEEEVVWRRRSRTGPEVDRPGSDEVQAVRQLLALGLLNRGGFHQVSFGRYETRGRSVLVPDSTAALSKRLSAYHRPASW